MRKLILFCLLFLGVAAASAQETVDSEITFIYIHHTTDTPVQDLCKRLNSDFKDAKRFDKPLIIYLANAEKPYVATVGINGADQKEFDNIISELQERRYHPVDPSADVHNIIDLFNDDDFLLSDGRPKYGSMTWQFYINQEFWTSGYNEQIIANLYYCLDLDRLPDEYLHLMLYYSGEPAFEYDAQMPFGRKGLCDNLIKLEILNY